MCTVKCTFLGQNICVGPGQLNVKILRNYKVLWPCWNLYEIFILILKFIKVHCLSALHLLFKKAMAIELNLFLKHFATRLRILQTYLFHISWYILLEWCPIMWVIDQSIVTKLFYLWISWTNNVLDSSLCYQ